MQNKFPEFKFDAKAETFVATSTLASSIYPMRFELRRKDTSISLRRPERLLDEVRTTARKAGMPYQRFIRMAIERALQAPK